MFSNKTSGGGFSKSLQNNRNKAFVSEISSVFFGKRVYILAQHATWLPFLVYTISLSLFIGSYLGQTSFSAPRRSDVLGSSFLCCSSSEDWFCFLWVRSLQITVVCWTGFCTRFHAVALPNKLMTCKK